MADNSSGDKTEKPSAQKLKKARQEGQVVRSRDLATAASRDGSIWLFSSSEALAHLRGLLPAVDWHAARAVATHERIAQAAREAGFGRVGLASPRLADLVASIESLG